MKESDETLKYGISGNGESRPKSQLKKLEEKYGVGVDYEIVDRAPENDSAKNKEQQYVDDYFEKEGQRPSEQQLPRATKEKRKGLVIKGIFKEVYVSGN